jgi:hypothetical protein
MLLLRWSLGQVHALCPILTLAILMPLLLPKQPMFLVPLMLYKLFLLLQLHAAAAGEPPACWYNPWLTSRMLSLLLRSDLVLRLSTEASSTK